MASPGSACTFSPGPWDPSASCGLENTQAALKNFCAETGLLLHKPSASLQHLNYSHTVRAGWPGLARDWASQRMGMRQKMTPRTLTGSGT